MGLRVLQHTNSLLEIEDRPTALRVIGAIFAVAGAAVLGLGWAQDRSVGALVSGVLFMTVGTGLAVGMADRRHRLDRRAGTLIVETRTQSAVTLDERRLGDVADVVVQASAGRGGGRPRIYRLAYVFADGTRLPWTSYYNSERRDKDACARLVREFLGLERSNAISW
ncbi:MAG TPA: hypothetical protein VNA89_03450 [Gemmatimonadaceae bacterium]|nr:hypothetical protein [Gemmatimonadaceae bacterium]